MFGTLGTSFVRSLRLRKASALWIQARARRPNPERTTRSSAPTCAATSTAFRASGVDRAVSSTTATLCRAFSPAVITEGGKVIWIAGHTGQKDSNGKSLAGDFDAQMRQTFKNIEATLKEAGASLTDIVTMTVFLADSRYTTRMTEIRTEIFGEDFPASAAITVTGFADPSMLIEIQGIAVVG